LFLGTLLCKTIQDGFLKNNMETVFDHNPTKEEIPSIFHKWSYICYNDHPNYRECGQKMTERLKDVITKDDNDCF